MDHSGSKIGDAPKRREDPKFLTGQGTYLEDLTLDGLCHAVASVLRRQLLLALKTDSSSSQRTGIGFAALARVSHPAS